MLPWTIGHQVYLNASPVYQNMVSLVVRLPIRRCPSKFMNVTMWEHCTFDSKIFGLSLLISCKLSFPIFGLKMSSLPTLTLKSPYRIFIWSLGNLSNTCSSSSVGAWAFRMMISHQWPLSIMYDILSLANSTLLTADIILLCAKNLYLIHDSHSEISLPLPWASLLYTYFWHSKYQISYPFSFA
jgi:hypothetical protein